ncbi:MAG: hypothetical protein CM1200mP37_1560 [Chloroflexota bacterium]|nr:MAG: hypothetical protein CM1200mP37_1560 [Chloroflexota bacterium]
MNQNDFAFSDFANNKFYSAVNKTLIELADLSNEKTCGRSCLRNRYGHQANC